MEETEQHELKQWLQSIFTDNLVIIVGSGLSCAEGLPSMGNLSEKLRQEMPQYLEDSDKETWNLIESSLDSDGLEGALLKHAASETIETAIIKITAQYVLEKEQETIDKCITQNKKLKISYLFPYISATTPKVAHIITTNYDRLIEFSAEYEGWGVDSMMVGRYWGNRAGRIAH